MSGFLHKPNPKERVKERILVLGTSQLAQQIAEAIDTTPSLRSAAIGFVSEHMNGARSTNGTHTTNGTGSISPARLSRSPCPY